MHKIIKKNDKIMKNLIQWMLMLSIVLGATTNLQAQKTANKNFSVKGVLVDSLTHEGEPYATIRIFKKGETMQAAEYETRDNVLIIRLKSDLDHHTAVSVRETADTLLARSHAKNILFDFLFTLRTIWYMCHVIEGNNYRSLRKR